eukprot:798741-Rhodomonas_salina.2
MPGTDLRYAAIRNLGRVAGSTRYCAPMVLRLRYAMPGTDVAYAPTRGELGVAMLQYKPPPYRPTRPIHDVRYLHGLSAPRLAAKAGHSGAWLEYGRSYPLRTPYALSDTERIIPYVLATACPIPSELFPAHLVRATRY